MTQEEYHELRKAELMDHSVAQASEGMDVFGSLSHCLRMLLFVALGVARAGGCGLGPA